MERSYSPEESDEFSVIDFSNDESRENGRSSSISQISPSLTSRSDNAMIGPEQSGRDKIDSILEALKSAIVSFEEHTQTEENLLKDIKNICSRAKSLESKLRNKKSLLINQFQNVVSNLDREN
ncbi:unnamed protein product [Heterobilharzia americana]|nr:unnamed protein product [Heterobilharzia americana]CAH8479484.1 unnamed protein product [Heterobilharzia americana]